jgi:4-amino-4-deoxy-L-arabinose transferase-like glycosyltransferase
MSGGNSDRAQYWVLTLGVAVRCLAFLFSSNNGGDAFARAATTAQWLQHPSLTLDVSIPDWPPVHFWLMAAVSSIVGDVTLGSRLLSLICGSISLWFFWRLAKTVIGDSAGLVSFIVFTFYSLHIGYSATSSSEACYLLFVLLGLNEFFANRRGRSPTHLAAGGLYLSIAAGIRFEAWVIIFILGLILLATCAIRSADSASREISSLVVFSVSAGMWPIVWMLHEWRVYGNPFYAFTYNRDLIPAQLAVAPSHSGLYQVLLQPGVLLLTLTPLTVACSIYGMVLMVKARKSPELVILISGFAVIQTYVFATHRSLALARYSLTLGTFLALVSGYGIWEISNRYLNIHEKTLDYSVAFLMALTTLSILVLSMVHNPYTDKFRSVSPLQQFAVHVEEVAAFLHPHLTPSDHVILDNYNSEANILAAALGFSLLNTEGNFSALTEPPNTIWDYIQSHQPRYLLISPRGTLKAYFPSLIECVPLAIVDDVSFKCVFNGRVYSIYELQYDRHPTARKTARHPTFIHCACSIALTEGGGSNPEDALAAQPVDELGTKLPANAAAESAFRHAQSHTPISLPSVPALWYGLDGSS